MPPTHFPQNQTPNTAWVWCASRVWDKEARPTFSGIGVWLGAGFESHEQLSEWVDDPKNSYLRSEIRSGIRALEQVLVHYSIDIEDKNVSTVVVHTDSKALVDAAVVMIPVWQPRYTLEGGVEMTDKKLYQRLSELVGIFHIQGIKVFFNLVSEEQVEPAVDLAQAAMIRDLPSPHDRHTWIVDFPGTSICHDRDLFVAYQPTLISHFDNFKTENPTRLYVLGRGWVHLDVMLCDGTVKKIAIKDVFHVPTAPMNIFSPDTIAHIRPGFLIHEGDAIALAQQSNMSSMIKVANGPKSLFPEHASAEAKKLRIPTRFVFLRGENEPPRLPPIPTDPRPVAYKLPTPLTMPMLRPPGVP